jgi:hypothetical protein
MILVLTGNNPMIYFEELIMGSFGSVPAILNLLGTMS